MLAYSSDRTSKLALTNQHVSVRQRTQRTYYAVSQSPDLQLITSDITDRITAPFLQITRKTAVHVFHL
jgi:hypothetical protein